jgi:hypothetical protein
MRAYLVGINQSKKIRAQVSQSLPQGTESKLKGARREV